MRVEAESPEAAIGRAEAIDFNEPEWDASWSPITAEPAETTEVSPLEAILLEEPQNATR
jgi:hypothetical protein